MIRDSKQTVGRGRTSATKHRLATEIDTKQKNQNKQTKKTTSNQLDIKRMKNFKDSICLNSYCVSLLTIYESLARSTDAEQGMFGFVIITPRSCGRSLTIKPRKF